ncbi:PIN domain-containing protein [Candidatus Saccharibacteria bacterium]|nr:PIN domain-containing protein [Candidatus Saccharibacteria bacterium]
MILDTDILLRFLLGEADGATMKLLEKEPVVLTDMVISEVVYVLHGKMYNYTRTGLAQAILALLARKNVQYISNADASYLSLYARTTLDLVDCYLIRLAVFQNIPLKTFDKKMQRTYQVELAKVA